MKYSRKRTYKKYARKRSWKRRTTKPKRAASKMMGNTRNAWTNQTWTQSFAINNNGNAASPFTGFTIDCLGNSNPIPASTSYFSAANTQTVGQTVFNRAYVQFYCKAVAVKLVFPENFGGNNPISWCLAYSPTLFFDSPSIQGNPSDLQVIQGSNTGAIPANRTISRYFNLSKERKRLGINSSEIGNWSYYNQLPVERPYIVGWIQNVGNVAVGNSCGTQLQVTYYMRYRQKI